MLIEHVKRSVRPARLKYSGKKYKIALLRRNSMIQ